jgi:hypothetical protein
MESAAVMKRASCSVALLLLAMCSPSAVLATNLSPAIPLTSVPNAYTDPWNFTWQGTTSFSDVDVDRNLSGTIDYAVFKAADFNAAFPAYAQPGPVVYAYQILVDDSTTLSDISHLSLSFNTDPSLSNPTSVPSPDFPFTGFTGQAPSSFGNDTESADWFFQTQINPGLYSEILVYSSPYLPDWSAWGVNDGGLSDGYNVTHTNPFTHVTTTNYQLLPSPGSMQAPEPGTATLVCLAGLFGTPMLIRRFRRP